MRLVRLLMCVLLARPCCATVAAHHSQSGAYIVAKDIRIEGVIAQVTIRSPHSFVHVDAKREQGDVVRWVAEWGSAAHLGQQGIKPGTLKPGDNVIVGGHPSRNPDDHRMVIAFIERPSDGWSWGHKTGEVVD